MRKCNITPYICIYIYIQRKYSSDTVCLALALAPSCAALHFWCRYIMLSKSYLPRIGDWKDGVFCKSSCTLWRGLRGNQKSNRQAEVPRYQCFDFVHIPIVPNIFSTCTICSMQYLKFGQKASIILEGGNLKHWKTLKQKSIRSYFWKRIIAHDLLHVQCILCASGASLPSCCIALELDKTTNLTVSDTNQGRKTITKCFETLFLQTFFHWVELRIKKCDLRCFQSTEQLKSNYAPTIPLYIGWLIRTFQCNMYENQPETTNWLLVMIVQKGQARQKNW